MPDILIVGVGGQGSLLASRILGAVFLGKGLDVKVSEVHGMSQRGGSVVTYVRAGERIASPLVAEGEADVLVAFEEMEALRYAHYLKKDGLCAVNTQHILPMPVITGAASYPENIQESLRGGGRRVLAFDALELAEKAGSVRAVNVVMLGAVSQVLEADEQTWLDALKACVKPEFYAMNARAFELGRAQGK